ncbi:MAG: Galactose/methyl galactoside import ATP-binding protein MglA [Anaerolineae bacterium]|nr:Galactose/methyl galactoside import ATP-binding protein MglA [Anaerolineae bacterium]RIK33957.1 MAG: heme ABC transporter ATP-binding protein [Chloroflexota bacterium]
MIQTVELRNITKRFPGVLANDRVNLQVRAGEILALLGENGAGKSTLMKILYGMYHPTEGEILVNGQVVQFKSPADALAQGIGMIHQHFQLVPGFTVVENVALGLKSSRGPLTDLDAVSKRVRELGAQYGLHVDPNALVWQLAVGQQQRVEIIKALYRDASLLILDEPTAVLTPQEVQEFFGILRRLRDAGNALIFISHKLYEVISISDRVTALRDGRVVGEVETKATTQQELARMMVGRQVVTRWEKSDMPPSDAVLQIKQLAVSNDKGLGAVNHLSLDVRAGEILGIAGVSGNGQRELAEAIAGMRRVNAGTVQIAGKDVTNCSPEQVIAASVSFIPEERMVMGVVREFSVAENAILETHNRPPLSKRTFFDFKQIDAHVTKLVREYDVKTPSLETPVKSLSGGNIQKLILARELARDPRVLIAAQPTRGVDIGATEYIHKRLIDQRAAGTAILLISEDLEEVRALSDRIAVMYEGEIVGIVPPDTSVEELGLMMAGAQKNL